MAVALKGFHLQRIHTSPQYSYSLTKNKNPIHTHRYYIPISNTSSYRLLLTLLSPSSSSSSTWPPIHVCGSRKMGTNTGFFSLNGGGGGGGGGGDGDDDDAEDSDEGTEVDQWFDVLEDYIDSIWIIKVFGSYGWMLPAIISSLLLATGPKTFLMALAIPLAQSTLSFAVERTVNKGGKKRRKTKTKTKRTRAAYSSRNGKVRPRKGKKSYPFWVQKNGNSSDVSSSSSNGEVGSRFGGWDELDEEGIDSFSEYYTVSEAPKSDESQERVAENGNRDRLIENDDGPLLLRLLVSFFPFLSSWTSLL